MTSRHWLTFAFIAVLLVAGALLVVAVSNRQSRKHGEEPEAPSVDSVLDKHTVRLLTARL